MNFDITIIGGGIIGLSTAMQLIKSQPKLKIIVLEKEKEIAQHQSSHNSGVIHSGIYYKPESEKAFHCTVGRELLIQFCKDNNIPFRICGKIIIATHTNELPMLDTLLERGKKNGLVGIKKITSLEIKKYEPHAQGIFGLHVPQTGIVDFKKVTATFAKIFENNGGKIYFGQEVKKITKKERYKEIQTANQKFLTKIIVNCAGLFADKISKLNNNPLDIKIIPFRGEYYEIKENKKYLVKNLIYPVPNPNLPFLGIHFSRHINETVSIGPNAVLAFKQEGYNFTDFDLKEFWQSISYSGFWRLANKYKAVGFQEFARSLSKKIFLTSAKKILPELRAMDIIQSKSGVRAQAIDQKGNLIDDFLILENDKQIDVLNAPSPAATASLSIGKKISQITLKHL